MIRFMMFILFLIPLATILIAKLFQMRKKDIIGWNCMVEPSKKDYILFAVVSLICYVSFGFGDIFITATHGNNFISAILNGDILGFYDYSTRPDADFAELFEAGTPAYLLPSYILFGIWSIPVRIIYFITDTPLWGPFDFDYVRGELLLWYKLLPTLFYFGTAKVIFMICELINIEKKRAKWVVFIYLASPFAIYSQFIFSQYDSIYIFFMTLAIYYFLKKKLYTFIIMMAIAMTFKSFPIFVVIPLILLVEKRVIHIAKYILISVSGYFAFTVPFLGSEAFVVASGFRTIMIDRVLMMGLPLQRGGTVSLFVVVFAVICSYMYVKKVEQDEERYTLTIYVTAMIFVLLFSVTFWHPQWMLAMVPFIAIIIVSSEKMKVSFYAYLFCNIVFILLTPLKFPHSVDAGLVNSGILVNIFNHTLSDATLTHRFSLNGAITTATYTSIFVAMLLIILLHNIPTKKNIANIAEIKVQEFTLERELIWSLVLTVGIYVVPVYYMFFRGL